MGQFTDAHRARIRRIVNQTHIEPVIRELAAICREHEHHAGQTEGMKAIGEEWGRAASWLDHAAHEVQE